jgi:hypothetical protein
MQPPPNQGAAVNTPTITACHRFPNGALRGHELRRRQQQKQQQQQHIFAAWYYATVLHIKKNSKSEFQ